MSADAHLGIQFSSAKVDELGTLHYAREGSNVIGYASTVHPAGEPVELSQLRVDDEHQGHGVGHQLLDHVISHHQGHRMVLTPSPFGNEALNRDQLTKFYGGHGFRARKDGSMSRRAR